ncbi:hypothetical protein WJX72_006033 [[Myrmecia] bisecta]|uniref:PIG-P domain-containing protein n=1 Tax=[Myrmecia] bisecta TaxID=41462 RepID=A0AAW1PSX6_9CHLO
MVSARGASSVEVYGFVGWTTSIVAYVAFLIWAYLPDQSLRALGITYHPDKYWAIALPAWVSVAVVFTYWMYEGACMLSAVPAERRHYEAEAVDALPLDTRERKILVPR